MEIKSSTSLRNQYNEISEYCKTTGKPVFLTKNGEGDLVVMSLKAYEERENILKIKEKLLEAKLARLNGIKGYSLEELNEAINQLLNK